MQFSDTTNLDGLVQDIDFICGTNSTSYPLKDKARNINQYYYRAGLLIWKYSPAWRFDDSNYTTLSEPTIDLVDGHRDYGLATNILAIDRAEVKDNDGGWHTLKRIDKLQIPGAVQEFLNETDGIPQYYDVEGNSILLYPSPATADVTLNAGLKLYLGRLVDPFESTDTTKEPGFLDPFHRILSYGASEDYLSSVDKDKSQEYTQKRLALESEMIAFYSGRQVVKPKLTSSFKSGGEQYR